MIGGSKGCLSVLCPYHANEPRGPWLAVKEERKKRKKRKERVRREGKRQGDLNDAAGLVCLSSIEQGCCSPALYPYLLHGQESQLNNKSGL